MDDVLNHLRSALAGRYEVEQELGHGGMAVVYLARDLRHDRKVAIKVLRQGVTAGAERFLREIRTVAQLHHPHILPLHDSGTAGDHLFYVMPYVEGETLRQRLEREGPLPMDEAVRIAREVADALEFAHGRGIVHRDIKPENIFISAGHALVADFGIARAADAAAGATTTLTDAGLAVGTPAYMSPEQATAEPRIDGRSDQYALGCVLYEMLAGAPPFTGPTSQAIMARHTVDPVPPLKTVRDVPPAVESAITRALAKMPADRWPTLTDFSSSLDRAAPLTTKHSAVPTAMTVAAVLVIAVLAGAWLLRDKADRRDGVATTPSIRKIALLPMVTGADSADLALAAGLTDGLNTRLAQVRGFYLLASGAARREGDVIAHGRDIGADAVISTSLQVTDNRFRVTVRVSDVGTSRVSFQRQFHGELIADGRVADLFRVQDEVADSVITALLPTLDPSERVDFALRKRTQNPEAYRLYLEARQAPLTAEGATQAMRLLNRAIALDSNYADAWVDLGGWYPWLPDLHGMRPADMAIGWRTHIEHAIKLDSMHALAYSSRGDLKLHYEWDIRGGLEDLRHAAQLAPGNAGMTFTYGVFLGMFGQTDSSLAYARRAVALDSVSALSWNILGKAFAFAGMRDSAIKASERSIAMDSTIWHTNWVLMNGHFDAGRRQDADRAASALLRHTGESLEGLAMAASYYRRSGDTARARSILEGLTAQGRTRYVPPSLLAAAHLAAGDRDRALGLIEQAMHDHDVTLIEQLVYGFGSLLGHQQYEAVRRQVFKSWPIPRNPFP